DEGSSSRKRSRYRFRVREALLSFAMFASERDRKPPISQSTTNFSGSGSGPVLIYSTTLQKCCHSEVLFRGIPSVGEPLNSIAEPASLLLRAHARPEVSCATNAQSADSFPKSSPIG